MPGYPTPPGPRIAYDLDGTIAFIKGLFAQPGMTDVHNRYLRAMNSDSPRNATARVGISRLQSETGNYYLSTTEDFPTGHLIALRFPEPMRIRALALATLWGVYQSGYIQSANWTIMKCLVETSDDSTNGEDGTWRQLYAHTQNDLFPVVTGDPSRPDETYGFATYLGAEGVGQSAYPSVNSNYRRESTGPGEPGWRAVSGTATRQVTWLRIRPYEGDITNSLWQSSGTVSPIGTGYVLHLYGEPDTAASSDRLIFTDVSGNPKPRFDWGDIGITSEHTQTFKVKNTSSTETATGVSIGIQTPDPSVLEAPQSWVKLSLDGVSWTNTVILPDLAPGDSSDTITLRVQAGTTVIGPSGPRLSAEVEEWV